MQLQQYPHRERARVDEEKHGKQTKGLLISSSQYENIYNIQGNDFTN